MKRFDDQVAVVTGASSGIGRRVALDLAARGAVVIGLARRAALLETLQHDLQCSSPRSRTAVCDVADVDQLHAVLADVDSRHGGIDILVNNAGVYTNAPYQSRPDRQMCTGSVRQTVGCLPVAVRVVESDDVNVEP